MNKYKSLFNRKLAIWRLKNRYDYLVEVDKLMEEFVTANLLAGGSQEFMNASRQQLLTLQNDIKSKEKMLDFLKRIK